MSSEEEGLFITQSVFSQENVDTDEVLSDVLSLEKEEINAPDFTIKTALFSDISDEEMEKITQEVDKVERNTVNIQQRSRFGEPLKESDFETLLKEGVCRNTEYKTKWAVNVFNQWLKNREQNSGKNKDITSFGTDFMKLTIPELNEAMSYFVVEVRNKNGAEYRPNSIYEIVTSIQHHFRTNGRFLNFLDDAEFAGLRGILDAKMKSLSKQGLGVHKKQADIISEAQERELWDKGILGEDTPQKLIDTVLFQFGLHFALRAGKEHRNLRCGRLSQITEKEDQDGRKYLEYVEDVSKTNPGGILHRKVAPKVTRAYENKLDPSKCPVRIYRRYLSLRPKDGKCDALYLRPKKYQTKDGWFADSPVGIHQLQHTVSRLCETAGFTGFYTNHSLRATAATRLYNAGVDEQLVVEKTGHRSCAVRNYKRTNDIQQANVSAVLQGKSVESAKKIKFSDDKENRVETGEREFNFSDGNVSFNLKF